VVGLWGGCRSLLVVGWAWGCGSCFGLLSVSGGSFHISQRFLRGAIAIFDRRGRGTLREKMNKINVLFS
jgi:hypothetical protein